MSCLVLPSLLKSKKGFLSRTRDRTGPRFRSLRFLSIGRFFTEERFYIIFLSNTLIVDTLKYCALKLSLLSTELDIASLSLLRSFHNIMHREGTNFIYSVGRFFLYLLSLSLYSVILFTYRFFLPFMQVVDSFRDKRWFAWRCGPWSYCWKTQHWS